MSATKEKRSKLDILTKILEAVVEGKTRKTHIMYSARLNFYQTQRFLNFLLEVNLVKEMKTDGRRMYEITEKGLIFLNSYKKVQELIKVKSDTI